VLSFALLNGRDLGKIMRFIRVNLLGNQDFLDSIFFQTDEIDGSNFIKKVLDATFSKQKFEACKELLEILKSDKVDCTNLLNHFQDHLKNSDPENSLLLDALKMEDFEVFDYLVEFVEDLSIFPKILSSLLKYYLSKFGDQFNILHVLRESLSPDSIDGNQLEGCSKSVSVLIGHFSGSR
jgi:hypothetical protein